MSSMQIVFLFDLSSCKDFLFKPKDELNKKLLSIRLACLRLLTDFSSKSPNLKWGFKFFDSDGPKTQDMYKFAYSEVSLEKFETLENEICVRYERHLSFLQALAESAQKNETSVIKKYGEMATDSPVKILQFALTQILCEFQWESMDMWSPSVKKIKTLSSRKRNYLIVFSDFKDSDEFLFKYFGLNNCLSKSKFIDTFLPQSLRDSLLKKSDIHLILLNTCLHQKFMGPFASKILPLLSHSLQVIQGSLVPLLILSQPLYNMKPFNDMQQTICEDKMSQIQHIYSSFRNSLIPFSYLFDQSLDQPFYSSIDTSLLKCCIEFRKKNALLPVQVIQIFKKKSNIYEGSLKNKYLEKKKITWSKFIVHFAVPRNSCHTAYEMLLCLPNDEEFSVPEAGNLVNLNKRMCIDGVDLVLECITECGLKLPGMMTPISCDAALISILDPSIYYLMHEPDCKVSTIDSLKNTNQINSNEFQKSKTEVKNSFDNLRTENSGNIVLKSFSMECLESWFKPPPAISKIAAHIESKSSRNLLKMESYWQLLNHSIRSKKISDKLSKPNLTNGAESNYEEKGTEHLADFETQTLEEFPDLSHEELLSTIKDIYKSAVELSGNTVTSAKKIVNLMINYFMKHKNTASVEEDVCNIFKEHFLMTAVKISEKYEAFESQEAIQQKIKECQIQVLLILEIENLKKFPDRSKCVNSVTSLLRMMIFYSGIEDLQNFLHDVIKKRYSGNLYDILVEIGDELNIPIFDDAEFSNSPADTLSSEFNIDDEAFGSMVSSVLSEKSTASTSSLKDNIRKDSIIKERKLIRHRSDISDSSRCRQVLLPKSASKKKKRKTTVAVRCSPRIAAQSNENVNEKPSKVRRNLFAGDKCNHTPKKINVPTTPKSNRKIETKFVAETPSHEQNLSAVQRRKSFIDKLSKSTRVDESPKILKTAKDNASEEFREKLEKANQESKKLKVLCQNIKECTPDSKRRLSLKLFSSPGSRLGIYTSPTARMGIKKCTKRLFHEISPEKAIENNKRHKPDNACKLFSHLIEKN